MNKPERSDNHNEHPFNFQKIKEFIKKKQIDTKKALQVLLATTFLVWSTWVISRSCSQNSKNNEEAKTEIKSTEKELSKINLKKKPIDLTYKEVFPEQEIQFIVFPKVSHSQMIRSAVSPEAKILRCMRRKAITDAAEDKYNIPRGLLMAMMAQEGAGDPTLPNVSSFNSTDKKNYKITKSDWGLGLIHIQWVNAEDFGLKVIQTRPGRRNARVIADFDLGKKIIEMYYTKKQDLKKLCEIDERWHPIEAIDCAARFLKSKHKTENGKDAWIKALEGYSGRKWSDKHSYPQRVLDYRVAIDHYLNKGKKSSIPTFSKGVNEYIKKTQQAGLGKQVEETAKSIEVEIGGVKWGYDFYLDYHAKQCENYELSKYINHQTKK